MEKQLALHQTISVTESSNVGQVRRALQELATRMALPEDAAARTTLVGTELSTNLLKHSASGGEILFRRLGNDPGDTAGIEILSIDKGGGIPNIGRALSDGFSTAGSPGTGLGAIQRMSDTMEIFSAPKKGTVISVEIRVRASGSRKFTAPRIRSICAPLEGFEVSGDFSAVHRKAHMVYIIVSDGLGHGEEAAKASQQSGRTFRENLGLELPHMMTVIHENLSKTRGAALALASFDTRKRILKYVAVGNIETRFCTEDTCHGCASLNGTAGVRLPGKVAEFEYEVPTGAALIMHTDGLSARWDLRDYPGLNFQSPGVMAALLYRDFARKRDDATILVFAT